MNNYEQRISKSLAELHEAAVIKTSGLSSRIGNIEHLIGVPETSDSLGKRILDSDRLQKFMKGSSDFAQFELTPQEYKSAIIGTGAANDPLTNTFRPPIAELARRRLRLRELLLAGDTIEAAVEYPIESSTTNTTAVQNRENTTFTESSGSFALSFEACQTIGHYMTVSKNVLNDSAVLNDWLNNFLLYGLLLKLEDQLLNGTGTNSELNGILPNATAYAVASPQYSGEMDIVRDAIKQLEVADYEPNAVVLNPVDTFDIDTRKAGTGNDEYTAGKPKEAKRSELWDLPIVATNSIAAGTFLVGDFTRGARLFDREQATIEISSHNQQNFEKGMLTIRATARVSLVNTAPSAMITGSL